MPSVAEPGYMDRWGTNKKTTNQKEKICKKFKHKAV